MEIERLNGSKIDVLPEERTVLAGRSKIYFTKNEWKIIVCLYQNRGEIVERAELLNLIGERDNPTRTVDVHVSNLRSKLRRIKGARIDNVYGHGYKLVMLHRI